VLGNKASMIKVVMFLISYEFSAPATTFLYFYFMVVNIHLL